MPLPDANTHPEATGAAHKLVQQHSEAQPLKLYAGWFCPFVQRVWLVLEEKAIPYQYIEVNPYHKPDSLLKLNPRGLVPTFEFENKPLYESTVVCEFLEEQYPEHGAKLLPPAPYDRARMRIWMDFVTSRIIPSWHRFLQFQPGQGKGTIDDVRKDYLNQLKQWTEGMDAEGPFFTGNQPMLVDFFMAPWAVRNWVFDEYKGGLGIPEEVQGGADEKVWNRWRKWLKAIESRPSIHNTLSETQYYRPIYQRYADDEAQSEMAKATRAGKGVP